MLEFPQELTPKRTFILPIGQEQNLTPLELPSFPQIPFSCRCPDGMSFAAYVMFSSQQITNGGIAMSWDLPRMFSIIDVLIASVAFVAIGIGVWIAIRNSRQDYGEWEWEP